MTRPLVKLQVVLVFRPFGLTDCLKFGKFTTVNPIAEGSNLTRRALLIFPLLLAASGLALSSTHASALAKGILSGKPSSDKHRTPIDAPTIFDKLVSPFVIETSHRRKRRLNNPDDLWCERDYQARIDWDLNANRVNFLLYGQGITNEPKDKLGIDNLGRIGSHSIFSYCPTERVVDIVSLTHDIRSPEVERFKRERLRHRDVKPTKIFHAFDVGRELRGVAEDGYALQKMALESATGLCCDFQVVFHDTAMVDLIDHCFGKIKVEIPKTFEVFPVFFEYYDISGRNTSQKHDRRTYEQGLTTLDGKEAVGLIKAVAVEDVPDPLLEHNARKKWVVEGVVNGIKENAINPFFWRRIHEFLSQSKIQTDFEVPNLLLGNIGSLFGLATSPFDGTRMSLMPEIRNNIYIVDQKHGAGGVRWINPVEVYLGGYEDPNMEIPVGADPYSQDFLNHYWGVPLGPRAVIKASLLH
jgi:hypothetical protein